MKIEHEKSGIRHKGAEISRTKLIHPEGLCATIISFGGILQRLECSDRRGVIDNIVLGFDGIEGYFDTHPYFGATVGRVANRIAKARFDLDGQSYRLAVNNGNNHLHGGAVGFDKVVWKSSPLQESDRVGVKLQYTSPDGDEGYPGRLDMVVTYWLNRKRELIVEYEARSDRRTPVNLTNHSYFNLGGAGKGKVLDHLLRLNCEKYLPVDDQTIPTGELLSVAGSPLDFRKPKILGLDLKRAGGYDHCFVVDGEAGRLRPAARVEHPGSGRWLEVETTEPGIQLYTGNYLDGIHGADGGRYDQHSAFCLEAQHFPDSVNQPHFPSTILEPGAVYRQTTLHRLGN